MPDDSQNIFEGDLYFNGINGETGRYGLDPMPTDKLVRLIVGKPAPGESAEQDLRFLEGLSEERRKLVDSLTDEQRQLLETLANKPQQLDQLVEEQQRFFEALGSDQQASFQRLLDEQQSLFQRVVDGQKQKLFENLMDEQRKLLGELLDERRKSYEEQKRIGELQFKRNLPPGFPVKEGVDPKRLDQSGWAVIFPAEMDSKRKTAIQKALYKLLKRRQEQSGKLFKIYEGAQGYRKGETKDKFLQRHKVGAGAADPEQMPFYVLLVGSPEEIPYEFQYQLDVMRGVGRLDFGDDYDAYARYAESVVMAEDGKVKLARKATFFGVKTPGDKATQLSADFLVEPLYENLLVREPDNDIKLEAEWQLDRLIGENQATKAQLKKLLGGDPTQTPALLLTASHGMEFPLNNPSQLDCQGALLCQDWPGPSGKLSPDHYFAGKKEDLPDDANVVGLIALFFACYGAGTPRLDQFAAQAFKKRKEIAPYSFVAALPKRLLSLGALAVIGHVERAWGYSFVMPNGAPDCQAFETALRKLMNGEPVGLATDPSFNLRYADMSSALSVDLDERKYDPPYSTSDAELAQKWTANNDARGYVVLGDPAVRIPFAGPDETPTERPVITASSDDKVSLDDLGLATATAEAAAKAPQPVAVKPGDYAASFGIGEQWNNLTNSVGQFTSHLAKALSDAAAEIATLKVRTYTTADIKAVSQGRQEDIDKARLQAMTTIAFDGDMQVYVPETATGEVDRALWQLHEQMVHEAQANRAQFLQALGEMATHLLKILQTMPDTTLQANLDPLGIWAASPETGVAFSIGGDKASAPVRRIALPESPGEAQSVLAANAQAIALTRQYLARAAQELALIGPPEQISFSTADELFAQKNSLASTLDQLRSPVSYGLKFKTDPEEQETTRGWLDFVEQVRQAVVNTARVSTELGSAPIGLTTVSWQGDFETTWALGVEPDEMQVHLHAVQVALDSRLEMVRTVSVVATGVANILLKATIPGAQLMLLPAVYRFVRNVVQQLRKQEDP